MRAKGNESIRRDENFPEATETCQNKLRGTCVKPFSQTYVCFLKFKVRKKEIGYKVNIKDK